MKGTPRIRIDLESPIPATRQIADALRVQLVEGGLQPGVRFPRFEGLRWSWECISTLLRKRTGCSQRKGGWTCGTAVELSWWTESLRPRHREQLSQNTGSACAN